MSKQLPVRKHLRLAQYDYSSAGAYFVTICTKNRACLLSSISGDGLFDTKTETTPYGAIAEEQLKQLETRYPFLKILHYVIMPNHIHFICLFQQQAAGASPRPTLTDIVCAYKSLTTRACKKIGLTDTLFQTSFYEHILRSEGEYEEIARYIAENPSNWICDVLYPAWNPPPSP